MASSTIFITATEARQNPIREYAVHEEARVIENSILNAVKNGLYQTTVTGGSPMTGNSLVNIAVTSVDTARDQLYIPSHPFKTGDIVTGYSAGALPSPLVSGSYYYVIYIDADHIKLATSYANAVNSIPASLNFSNGVTYIAMTNNGAGYYSTPAVTLAASPTGNTATAVAHLASYGVVDSIGLTSHGSGYNDVPSVTISAYGSGAVAGAVSFTAVGVTVATAGIDYRVGDLLVVDGGTGTSTTATVTSVSGTGAVLSVLLSTPGLYTVLPTLVGVTTSVSPGGGNGCTLNLSMGIGAIAVAAGGIGYTANPVVSLSGGSGSGASVSALISAGTVVEFQIVSAGAGYTGAPLITVDSGSGAGAFAVLQPTGIGAVVITDPGSGYVSAPTVTITPVGSGATVDEVIMRIVSATLTNSGSGYTVGDTLLIAGGAGTENATIVVTKVGTYGEIISHTLTTSGAYTELPVLNHNSVLGGSGRSATFGLTAGLLGITVSANGSGYLAPPVVVITPVDGNGSGALADSIITSGSVNSIRVTAAGSGYTDIPTVTISSGSSASAVATVSGGVVTGINMTSWGSNYTYPPTVTIDGNATGRAVLQTTGIARIEMTAGGSNYSAVPAVYVMPGVHQSGIPVSPAMIPNIGYAVADITVTSAGSGYESIPLVSISTPEGNFAVQATADASIGVGSGTTILTLYYDAVDYWKIWKNQNPSDLLYTRPYTERMDTVIAYFKNLGYTITRQTNPSTGNTIQWLVQW